MKTNFYDKGVSIEHCITNGRNKGVKITLVTTANEHADIAYEIVQNVFRMVDVDAVGKQKLEVKKVDNICQVKFRQAQFETAFLKKLTQIQRRVQKTIEWVAVYQTMIRMGVIYPVEFTYWLKWLNPICQVKFGKMAMSLSSARRIPSVLVDYKVEWSTEAMAEKLVNEKTSLRAAKTRVTHLGNRMEIMKELINS